MRHRGEGLSDHSHVQGDAAFNRRLVDEVATSVPPARVVAELGFGPGVGLAALLSGFPDAHVLGADPSPALAGHAAGRNRAAIDGGRLRRRSRPLLLA